jgi:holliday junction DNA helicase RuvA
VRDTAITLYGFADRSERRCFEVLVATHGVGPGLALAILGLYRPHELARLVATNDEAALTAVPGVGRKTAARLLVELGTRVEDLTGGVVMAGTGAGEAARAAASEVGQALAALGYGPDEVRPLLAALPEEEDPEMLLRQALRQLAAHR